MRSRSSERFSRKEAVPDSVIRRRRSFTIRMFRNLEPPQRGYHALFGAHAVEGEPGVGMVFLVECPTGGYRCIQDERHQDLRPSSRPDSNSANCNPAGTLAKLPDARQGLVDLFLPPVGLGHDPGNPAPVTGNNQRCAPLHFIQELRKMNLGFRGLNFAHRINQSIRPVLL